MPKTALITGCNSMLGVAIARKLLQNGLDIIAHYHSGKERIEDLEKDFPGKIIGIFQAEFDQIGVENLLNKLTGINMDIDVLVNNAATVGGESTLAELSWQKLIKTFEVNLFAAVILSASIFEKMKQKGGKIINISSVGAKYGGGEKTMHYGISKAAIDAMTINLARQGAPFRILVNSIRPGLIDTDFHEKNTPSKDMNKRINLNPLKRMANPEEIADMVSFLVSGKGDYITGEIITIAGGD